MVNTQRHITRYGSPWRVFYSGILMVMKKKITYPILEEQIYTEWDEKKLGTYSPPALCHISPAIPSKRNQLITTSLKRNRRWPAYIPCLQKAGWVLSVCETRSVFHRYQTVVQFPACPLNCGNAAYAIQNRLACRRLPLQLGKSHRQTGQLGQR